MNITPTPRQYVIVVDDDDRAGAPETPWTANVYADTATGQHVSSGFGADVLSAIREAFEDGSPALDADAFDLSDGEPTPGPCTVCGRDDIVTGPGDEPRCSRHTDDDAPDLSRQATR